MAKPFDKIVLFDGICNFCNANVQFLLRNDRKKRFRFAPLQSSAASELAKQFHFEQENLASIVYLRKGRIYRKSSAVLYILRDLGGLWSAFFIFIIIPKPLRDFVYQSIAKRRYRLFGKKNECMVPDASDRERFLI